MTRLWLHAGFHKTGTTAVQEFGFSQRRALLRSGLFYPALRRRWLKREIAHHSLAHSVSGRLVWLTHEHAKELLEKWHSLAEQRGLSVLLSAEPMCRHVRGRVGKNRDVGTAQLEYISRLHRLLQAFDVMPVLVVRRQDDFVRSFYQEAVARGTNRTASMDFRAFRQKVGGDRARFLPVVERFESVFGDVKLLVYEDLCRQGLVKSFFSELGVEIRCLSGSVVRKSLTVRQTLVKQVLNSFISDKKQNMRLIGWLHSKSVLATLEKLMPREPDLWCSVKERREFLEQYTEENEVLQRRSSSCGLMLFPQLLSDESQMRPRCPDQEELAGIVRLLALSSGRSLKRVIGKRAYDRLLSK